ncbi:DUF1963 domain-containing protein [Corallococcus macrosporus]|uniref:DUF1963 domain-containing protein n=1 Tax=Myxococcus fulvus (strain ATCC BAA-855 / HW-1) TaxID=483219 RepID=F8CH05_MYXFH|nr:DUF1963 domain-containing protein [Corallococcus macrosporus]AEI63714.1 hypothetical protein LILAB_09015 [Corallococcus macrosporus]
MKPPLELPEDLRRMLRSHSPELESDIERFLETAPAPCLYIRSERVARSPLRPSLLHRLMGHRAARPVLSALDSKFGGIPYVEEADLTWDGFHFLGQLNFAQLGDTPATVPRHGLFALDRDLRAPDGSPHSFRVRWYPEPTEARARPVSPPPCVGRWETRMRFSAGWSLPGGDAWEAPLSSSDAQLRDTWNDWTPAGYLEDEQSPGLHRVSGHRSAGLDEPSAFVPPHGRGRDLQEYTQLLRVAFDSASGFHWGTSWAYVLIHPEDLARNQLERAVVAWANA